LKPAKLISEPVCVEPIKKGFVSGYDFSRAEKSQEDEGFSPCGAISLSLRLRVIFDSSNARRTLPLQHSKAPEGNAFH
jgi:hypothetical protein